MINNLQSLVTYSSHQKNNTAIFSNDRTYSYNEIDILSSSFAEYLRDKIRKEKYIGIYLENSADFVITVLALWKIGVVPVPLNLSASDDELIQQILYAKLEYVISNQILRNKLLSQNVVKVITINKKSQIKDSQRSYKLNLDQKAVIIFTSGATGKPKGVVHTFNSLLNSVITGNEIFNHSSDDRWLASLPFYHIGGFQIILRSLYFSTGIIIPESLQTDKLTEAIIAFKPTHASFVSTQLKRLLDKKVKPNIELRCSLIGGGFVDKKLLLDAKKSGWHPVKVYGSSETASFVCALKEKDIESRGNSTGKVINKNKVKIIDEDGSECSMRTESEIVIKSKSLFQCYLHDESETKQRLKKGYYFSGDIGYFDDDGYLYVTGRKNEMIVTGGKNVNPVEVENVILKYPGIVEAAVFSVDEIEWGEIVCAAIVTSQKIRITELKSFLKRKLSSYKIPKKIFKEKFLPKSTLGKIERSKLKLRYN